MRNIHKYFVGERTEPYARFVHDNTGSLCNYVGFFDVILLDISRLGDSAGHKFMFSGHKRKHDLKYQVVPAPGDSVCMLHALLRPLARLDAVGT